VSTRLKISCGGSAHRGNDAANANGAYVENIGIFPFVLSPSMRWPFVLSLSKETASILRTGLSKPVVSVSNRVNGGFVGQALLQYENG
ncbi:MAG: hypothetical protein ACE5J1_04800, partial [Nitrospiria bacterium]